MASTIYSKAGTDAAIAAAIDAIPSTGTGGSVTSVNGQTGAVVLDAADVGADPAGTAQGLVDALVIPDPDLSGYVQTTDPRLTDARTPTAHTHVVADLTDYSPGSGALDTEAVQDVVGAMIAGAGGTYDDTAGTITLPAGGSTGLEVAPGTRLVVGGSTPTVAAGETVYWIHDTTIDIIEPGDTQAPTTPAALTATPTGPTTITLSWSAATDNVGVAGYEVTVDAGESLADVGNVTDTTRSGLTASTSYTFAVRAYDAAGNRSPWSSPASATTQAPAADATAPTWTATFALGAPTPTGIVATASAMATDNIGVAGYDVSYNGGGAWTSITPAGNNFTLVGTAGTTYAATQLRARDAAGNTSTPVLSVPSYTLASPDTTQPTPGTLASASITQTSFSLIVSGAADETLMAPSPYRFSTDNGATWSAWQASATYTASGLPAGTTYQCLHQVRDNAGNIATGSQISVTTTAAVAYSIFDPFDAADTTVLNGRLTPTGSLTWVSPAALTAAGNNAATITGNRVESIATGGEGAAVQLAQQNIRVSIDYSLVDGTASNRQVRLAARANSAAATNNLFRGWVTATSATNVTLTLASPGQTDQTKTLSGASWLTGRISLQCVGNVATLAVNGVDQLTATDTGNTAVGNYAGFSVFSTNAYADNFGVEYL